jgi:hypothetical protein
VVRSDSGNITIVGKADVSQTAAADILTTGGLGTIDVEAETGSITMADGAVAGTNNTNIRYKAAVDIALGGIDAGGGDVSLVATTGNIIDNGNTDAEVLADGLRMVAGGNIGEPAGINNGHLDLTVNQLAADASGTSGIFITNSQGVTVAAVDTVSANRVNTAAGEAAEADTDGLSDLTTRINGGSIVLVTSTGNLTITDGDLDELGVEADQGGNILLQSESGSAVLEAAVQSDSGNITIVGKADVSQTAAADILTTGGSGTIDVEAETGSITMTDGAVTSSSDADIRYKAALDVTVGRLITTGNVNVTASSGTIYDGGDNGGEDLAAAGLQLEAGIGAGVLGGSADSLEIKVDTIAASAGTGGINILETDDIATGRSTVFDTTLNDLRTEAGGAVVLRTANGTITVTDSDDDGFGVKADGGNILLEAQGEGSDILVRAGLISSSGHILVVADHDVEQSGSIYTAGGDIGVVAGNGAVTMSNSASSTSGGGNIHYSAVGNIVIGGLDAGQGGIALESSSGGVLDGGDGHRDVAGSALIIQASAGFGIAGDGTANLIETSVDTVAADINSGGLLLWEENSLTVGSVSMDMARVQIDGAESIATISLAGVSVGSGKLDIQVADGALTVENAVQVNGAEGLLQTHVGDVVLNSTVSAANGNVVIVSGLNATFKWNADPEASGYILRLYRNGASYDSLNLDGDATQWSPAYDLPAGEYHLELRTRTGAGIGPVQDFAPFIIMKRPVIAATATSFVAGDKVLLEWEGVETAAWYHLQIERDGSVYLSEWLEGTTSWSPDFDLPVGDYIWTVQPWGPNGSGGVSNAATLSITATNDANEAGQFDSYSEGAEVILEWNRVNNATWYHLEIERDGVPYLSEWIENDTVWKPSFTLPVGTYAWTIESWGPNGYGEVIPMDIFIIQ